MHTFSLPDSSWPEYNIFFLQPWYYRKSCPWRLHWENTKHTGQHFQQRGNYPCMKMRLCSTIHHQLDQWQSQPIHDLNEKDTPMDRYTNFIQNKSPLYPIQEREEIFWPRSFNFVWINSIWVKLNCWSYHLISRTHWWVLLIYLALNFVLQLLNLLPFKNLWNLNNTQHLL